MIESLKYVSLEFAVDMYRGAQLAPSDVVRAARQFERYLEEDNEKKDQGAEQDSTATEE